MKGAAFRRLALPLDLCVGLSLISALIYALVLRAPYPLAEGLAHPLASWATQAGFSWRAGLALVCAYALLTGYYMFALRLAARVVSPRQRTLLILIVGGWLLSSAVLLGHIRVSRSTSSTIFFAGGSMLLWVSARWPSRRRSSHVSSFTRM